MMSDAKRRRFKKEFLSKASWQIRAKAVMALYAGTAMTQVELSEWLGVVPSVVSVHLRLARALERYPRVAELQSQRAAYSWVVEAERAAIARMKV